MGQDEINALYGLPRFSEEERLEYFSLSPTEKVTLRQLRSIKSQIYFMLQLGYFKSHHLFFVFGLPEVEADVRYIQEQYFPSFQLTDLSITKVTMSIDPKSKLREFSCGPASDKHAGGSPGRDPEIQPFHRVKGGFLSVEVSRDDDVPTIRFRHRDVHGKITNEFKAASKR